MEQEEFYLLEHKINGILDNSSTEDLEALCSFSGLSIMRENVLRSRSDLISILKVHLKRF